MWNPTVNWQPASSFVEPVAIPDATPGDAPGVSICLNKTWLPYVIGALMQLIQPTTWDTSDPTVLQAVLDNVNDLLAMFGDAEACMQLRWSTDDCAIEVSTDGGTTWTPIDGWDLSGVQGCVLGGLSIRFDGGFIQWSTDGGTTWTTDGSAPPPNPQGVSTAAQACNIATWLAINVISNALGTVATAISTAATLIDTADALLLAIPVLGEIDAVAVGAATILFNGVTSIGHAAVASAAADPVLQADVQCAIYNAILADGFVTDANYPTIVTNINAISYGTPGIVGLIVDYLQGVGPVTGIGASGLQQIQQRGTLYVGDCSGCGATVPCAVFGGGSDYLAVNSLSNFHPTVFSIIGWLEGTTDSGCVLSHDRSLGNAGWLFDWGNTGGSSHALMYVNNGSTAQSVSSASSGIAGAHSVAMVWDGSTATIYKDGASLASGSITLTPASDGTQGTQIARGAGQSLFTGKMLDLRIYTGTLSGADVVAFNTAGPGAYPVLSSATLVAQWKFDEGSGNVAHDSSGNGNTATWNATGHWGTW